MKKTSISKIASLLLIICFEVINLLGCKEKVEEVKIIKEQEVEQKETIKIDDMEVTMAPLQPSLQLELPTEPPTEIEVKEPEVKEEQQTENIVEEPQAPQSAQAQPTPPPQPQAVTGTDKNGHQYLQPDAEFTFGADGFPIEAPTDIYKNTVTNPNNGINYWYSNTHNEWRSSESAKKVKERAEAIRDGKMNSKGDTDIRHLTDEEARQMQFDIG